jgi:hypothetical protein
MTMLKMTLVAAALLALSGCIVGVGPGYYGGPGYFGGGGYYEGPHGEACCGGGRGGGEHGGERR